MNTRVNHTLAPDTINALAQEEKVVYTKEEAQKRQAEIRTYFNRRGIRYQLECLMRTFAPKRGNKLRLILNTDGGAYTDGTNVVVGLFDFMWPLSNPKIYSSLKAMTAHETAHVLFTDMPERKQFIEEVGEYFKTRHNLHEEVGRMFGAYLSNALEDGRIEYKMVNRYPGMLKHIKFMRGMWWENMSLHKTNKETGATEKDDDLGVWTTCVVTLATTGMYPKDFTPSEFPEIFDLITKQTPYIRSAVLGQTHSDCIAACWNLIKASEDYLAKALKPYSENQEMMDKLRELLEQLIDDMLKEGGEAMNGDNGEGDGDGDGADGQPSPSNGKGNGKTLTVHFDASVLGDGEGSGDGDGEKKEDEKDGKGNGAGEDDKKDDKKEGEGAGDGKEDPKPIQPSDKKTQQKQAKAGDKQSKESQGKMSNEMKALSAEVSAEAAQNLNRIDQQEKAEEAAKKAKENEGRADFNMINGDFDYIPEFEIESFTPRPVNVPMDIKLRGRTMRTMFQKLLKNENDFAYTGQKKGSLNTKALWRYGIGETDIFMKKVVDSPSYAVSLLVDGSGSMATRTMRDGKRSTRYEDALAAAATIEEGLNGLVPLSITVFDDDGGTTTHREVRRFKPSKLNHSWSFFDQNPYPFSANRDGYSIRVVGEELLTRNETTKILFVISDGQPAAYNFSRGVDETAKAVKILKDKGLIVIAISIGMDNHSGRDYQRALADYQKMYGDDLIVSEPSRISDEVSRLLKKLLK